MSENLKMPMIIERIYSNSSACDFQLLGLWNIQSNASCGWLGARVSYIAMNQYHDG